MPRPPPPAAALTSTGKPISCGDLIASSSSVIGARRTRHARNAERQRRALGLDLVAHDADVLGLGADEADVVVGENFCEFGVFRKKTVAGMDGVGAGDLAGREKGGNIEIGLARRRRPDADRFVGQLYMHGFGVGRRVDGDRRYAQLLRGAQDSQGDFAAIGDQDFLEHRAQTITNKGWPYSTGWPSSTRMAVTAPVLRDNVVESLHRLDQQHLLAGEDMAPISMKAWRRGSAANRRCRPSAISVSAASCSSATRASGRAAGGRHSDCAGAGA